MLLTAPRCFEYLAACEAMRGTPVPGKDSFTSALIVALEDLLERQDEGRFTTVELLRRIKLHEDFPRDQTPVLTDREDIGPAGRIMLHPLHREAPKAHKSPKPSSPLEEVNKHTVTLKFDFDEKPLPEDVGNLGTELNSIFEQNRFKVNGVRWGGLKPSMAVRVVRKLMEGHNRRASMKRERQNEVVDSSEEYTSTYTLEPTTPSPTSQYSPQLQGLIIEDTVIDPSHLSPTNLLRRSNATEGPAEGRPKRRKLSPRGRIAK